MEMTINQLREKLAGTPEDREALYAVALRLADDKKLQKKHRINAVAIREDHDQPSNLPPGR